MADFRPGAHRRELTYQCTWQLQRFTQTTGDLDHLPPSPSLPLFRPHPSLLSLSRSDSPRLLMTSTSWRSYRASG